MCSKLIANELQKYKVIEKFTSNIVIEDEWVKKFELTKRECEVIELIINNNVDLEISIKLNISISTVRAHINSIFKKINISSKIDLLNFAYNEKINLLKDELLHL